MNAEDLEFVAAIGGMRRLAEDLARQKWTHTVTLIGSHATRNVLFWHKSENIDVAQALEAWGKPVGTVFGTWLEVWLIGEQRAALFFGR